MRVAHRPVGGGGESFLDEPADRNREERYEARADRHGGITPAGHEPGLSSQIAKAMETAVKIAAST